MVTYFYNSSKQTSISYLECLKNEGLIRLVKTVVVKKSVMKTRVGVKTLIKITWFLLLFKLKIDQKGLMGWLGLIKIAVGSFR